MDPTGTCGGSRGGSRDGNGWGEGLGAEVRMGGCQVMQIWTSDLVIRKFLLGEVTQKLHGKSVARPSYLFRGIFISFRGLTDVKRTNLIPKDPPLDDNQYSQ